MDTQRLAQQLGARGAVIAVADQGNEHTHYQLGNSIAVLARGVHHAHAVGGSLGQVDVVITCTSAYNHLQLGSGVKHFLVHLVAAHDQAGTVGDSLDHVLTGAFLNQDQFVACTFDHFTDALYGYGSKGLLGCN